MPLEFVSEVFFFFKQKTAYEMRISDWSSDVCSSDLVHAHGREEPAQFAVFADLEQHAVEVTPRRVENPLLAAGRSPIEALEHVGKERFVQLSRISVGGTARREGGHRLGDVQKLHAPAGIEDRKWPPRNSSHQRAN